MENERIMKNKLLKRSTIEKRSPGARICTPWFIGTVYFFIIPMLNLQGMHSAM